MKTPPNFVSIRFCPVCGRTDRFVAFTGKSHKVGSKRCPGNLIEAKYKIVGWS